MFELYLVCIWVKLLLTTFSALLCVTQQHKSHSRQKDKSRGASLRQRQNRSIPCAILFFFSPFNDCFYYDGVIHLQATDTGVSQKSFPAAFSAATIRLGETSLKCTYGLKGLWNQIFCLYSYSSCSCFIAVLRSPLNNLLSASCRPAATDPRANEKSVYMKPWRLNGAFIVYRSQEQKRFSALSIKHLFCVYFGGGRGGVEKEERVRWKCICANEGIEQDDKTPYDYCVTAKY